MAEKPNIASKCEFVYRVAVYDLEFQVFGHSSEVLEAALDLYKQLGGITMPRRHEGMLPLHFVIGIDELDSEFAINDRIGVPGHPYRSSDQTTTLPRLFSHIKPVQNHELHTVEPDFIDSDQLSLNLD